MFINDREEEAARALEQAVANGGARAEEAALLAEVGCEYLRTKGQFRACLLYTSDAADDTPC
eukprot:2597823-Pyramimonas_sp.AAC.2